MTGADQGAMDLLSRMVVERLSNLGKTFRLLIDGFSQKMSSEVCPFPDFHSFYR
jgi:transcriptional activator SPT7